MSYLINLLGRQSRGDLDLVIAIHRDPGYETSSDGWGEKLVWVTGSAVRDALDQWSICTMTGRSLLRLLVRWPTRLNE